MENSRIQLYKQIEKLIMMEKGDTQRLEHIKTSLEQNKRIYKSDVQYAVDLSVQNGIEPPDISDKIFDVLKFCKKCNGELVTSGNFCPYCGVEQETYSDFEEVASRRKLLAKSRNIIAKIRLYQVLAVIGSISILIPVSIGVSSIDRIEELAVFYFEYDISEFTNLLYGLGTISILWSLTIMILPFVLKRPKQVGKFMFFSSFGILIVSLLTGVVGFVLILAGGIIALKRRYTI